MAALALQAKQRAYEVIGAQSNSCSDAGTVRVVGQLDSRCLLPGVSPFSKKGLSDSP